MNTEQFVRRNQVIAQHLYEIALHSGEVEAGGRLLPVNLYFRAVLKAQEGLLNAAERLLEHLPKRMAGS